MYPYFIEVEIRNGPKAIINIDNIKAVSPHPESMDNTDIYYSVGGKETVRESYDEVMQLLKDAGTHIQKSDPRLDTTTPLTKEDIKEMGVGEPVWHSNKMLWGIITNWCDLESGFLCTLVTHKSFVDMDENDLIKYPLYRMKQ